MLKMQSASVLHPQLPVGTMPASGRVPSLSAEGQKQQLDSALSAWAQVPPEWR